MQKGQLVFRETRPLPSRRLIGSLRAPRAREKSSKNDRLRAPHQPELLARPPQEPIQALEAHLAARDQRLRPSSAAVIFTSQSCWLRPSCSGRPSASSSPPIGARAGSLWCSRLRPPRRFPRARAALPRAVARDALDDRAVDATVGDAVGLMVALVDHDAGHAPARPSPRALDAEELSPAIAVAATELASSVRIVAVAHGSGDEIDEERMRVGTASTRTPGGTGRPRTTGDPRLDDLDQPAVRRGAGDRRGRRRPGAACTPGSPPSGGDVVSAMRSWP